MHQMISPLALYMFESLQQGQQSQSCICFTSRAAKLSTVPTGQEATLASLAVCAGFDFVSFTDRNYIEIFVKAQSGYQAVTTSYIEGQLVINVSFRPRPLVLALSLFCMNFHLLMFALNTH